MNEVWWTILAQFLALPPVRALIIWYAKRHPYFHLVREDGSTYMERYWLFNPDIDQFGEKKYPKIPYSIRVHWIRQPDRDRWPHNHPGDFRTFILKYWYRNRHYLNEYVAVSHVVQAGETMAMKETDYHQVSEVPETGVWTLFVMREPRVKKEGSWGFLVEGQYVPWRKFLSSKDAA